MILCTGGLGFVGSNLVRLLLDNGKQVRVLDNMTANTVPVVTGAELAHGDILNIPEKHWLGVDTVVHLAAVPGVVTCATDPVNSLEVNVGGVLAMLVAATKHGVRQFVLASSVGAVLGVQAQPANEMQTPHPQTLYGWSKLMSERLAWAVRDRIKVCVLRFTNVYGENSQRKESVIAGLLKRKPDAPFTIYGDGKQTRDFVYVGDVCGAVLCAVDRVAEGLFHIGSGYGLELRDLVGMVEQVTGIPIPLRYREARSGDVRDNYTSIEKAKDGLGWSPQVGIEDGLERTWRWFKQTADNPDDDRVRVEENHKQMRGLFNRPR